MRIDESHELGQEEAIRRIDGFLEEMRTRRPPAGVSITDEQKVWNGDRMDFSFRAAKGFIGATIRGTVRVAQDSVTLHADIPGLITAFVGEQRIKDAIGTHLRALLDGGLSPDDLSARS